MQGLMMDYPLTLRYILERVNQFHAAKEVVSKLPTGVHRYTYGDFYRRVHRLANVLQGLGVKPGDRVATFAWNSYRHLELYYAVPCMGAVLHTLNIRLDPGPRWPMSSTTLKTRPYSLTPVYCPWSSGSKTRSVVWTSS